MKEDIWIQFRQGRLWIHSTNRLLHTHMPRQQRVHNIQYDRHPLCRYPLWDQFRAWRSASWDWSNSTSNVYVAACKMIYMKRFFTLIMIIVRIFTEKRQWPQASDYEALQCQFQLWRARGSNQQWYVTGWVLFDFQNKACYSYYGHYSLWLLDLYQCWQMVVGWLGLGSKIIRRGFGTRTVWLF